MAGLLAPAAISWSGGKDSCLALLRAREAGVDVRSFVTTCDEGGASKSHALPPALIEAQVAAFGGAWWPVRVPARPGAYAECFDTTLLALAAGGHRQMVFGDIDLAAHRDWIEPRCAAAGIEALFPLWGEARSRLAEEVLARGIRARIVAIDLARLGPDFAGAEYDAALLARLPAGVCPCGEEGEFHTVVWQAPGMAHALKLAPGLPRRVMTAPPLAPAELMLCTPQLARAAPP